MLDFGKFCYLDVQKSGSTFVREFLTRHITLPPGYTLKHAPLSMQHPQPPKDKLFIISVREPLDTYLSLYHFGGSDAGGVREVLRESLSEAEITALYDGSREGFYRWLDFMLTPTASALFGRLPELQPCGLLTWRFLRLALHCGEEQLAGCRDAAAISAVWRQNKLHGPVLRNETLNQDLAELVQGALAPWVKDVAAALAELAELDDHGGKRVNASDYQGWQRRDSASRTELPDELRAKLAQQEWFFAAELGYVLHGEQGDGGNPQRGTALA